MLLSAACAQAIEATLQSSGAALVGHPDASVTSVTLVGGGRLGGFYALTVEGPTGHFGGTVLYEGERLVDERGLDAASALAERLELWSAELELQPLIAWLEHLEALPAGFETSDLDVAHPREGAARRTDDGLVLFATRAAYDQRTADPAELAFGSDVDLGRGYAPPTYVRASLVVGDGLTWTVEREEADGSWAEVP